VGGGGWGKGEENTGRGEQASIVYRAERGKAEEMAYDRGGKGREGEKQGGGGGENPAHRTHIMSQKKRVEGKKEFCKTRKTNAREAVIFAQKADGTPQKGVLGKGGVWIC